MNANANFAVPVPRTIWHRLGFGVRVATVPAEIESDPSWAEACLQLVTRVRLDWRDRLRILVSGRCHIDIKVKTNEPVVRSIAFSAFSVLPPGNEGDAR